MLTDKIPQHPKLLLIPDENVHQCIKTVRCLRLAL